MPELRPFYDVIVVGAGTAGAVVAQTLARLLPNKSILVIESGPNLDPSLPVALEPANSPNLFVAQSDSRRQQPPQAFTRQSVPPLGEAQVPANVARHFPNYVQGRGWGGSGAINGLVCQPGHPADYDRWAHEYGCTGWSWFDIAPTLTKLRSELFTSTPSMYLEADRALLAAHTELTAQRLHDRQGFHSQQGWQGWQRSPDQQGPRGLGDSQGANGLLGSAWLRLEPATLSILENRRKLLGLNASIHYSNLHSIFSVDVERILTVGTAVHGVKFTDGREVECNHMIVSTGAIGTPVLLQRSNIGRPGVGHNLHDHTSVSVTLDLAGTEDKPCPTNVILESNDCIQILPVSQLPNQPNLGVWMASPFQAIHGRGRVSNQSDDTIIVQFDSFSDERDRAHLRNAARLLGELLKQLSTQILTQPLIQIDTQSHQRKNGPSSTKVTASPLDPELGEKISVLSDEELDTWVYDNQGSYHHAAGTCRMGAPSDPRSVVDQHCNVLGWSNISVIDASIFPDLPMANPYLPTVAVAKLAATRLANRLACR